ncbi:MAG: AMP-binding protein [Planctomycetota bacterium]|nr:AMP-binding protein [Planctomycetota bacterium]
MPQIPRTIPAHFVRAIELHGDIPILIDRQGSVTLRELAADVARVANALRAEGVKKGDPVGFYADNSRRWILTDLAIMLAGGVSVPRGTDTPPDELAGIFRHAEVGLVFAHSGRHAKQLETIRAEVPSMGEIISIDSNDAPGRTLDDLLEAGAEQPDFATLATESDPDDLATIIYTSGTTGRPKGVMLNQSNLGHQAACCPAAFRIEPGQSFLSVLPPWHSFERSVEYIALCSGAALVYTDRRRFKEDLARYEPTFVPSVPRIWETVYDGVQKALEKGSPIKRAVFKSAYAVASVRTRMWDRARGWHFRIHKPRGLAAAAEPVVRGGALLLAALTWLPDRLGHKIVFSKMRKLVGSRLRGAISGGGLMPGYIDRFFRTIELPLLVGYGLTETSPVVSVRRMWCNVLGTIGRPVDEVEVQVRDPETGAVLPAGETGLFFSRGPHIMQGYYKDEELTRTVLDEDGWLDTGDLGMMTEYGDLCFRGRLKETIVLKGGENIEPTAIEEALLGSPLIEQAVVVGQDRKVLAALLVPNAGEVADALGIEGKPTPADLATRDDVRELLRREARTRTSSLRSYELIARIALLPETLESSNGLLTQTLKLRRHVIVDRFAEQIEEAYAG